MFQFTDEECKEKFVAILKYKEKAKISRATGIHPTQIDDYFNAKEIRPSPMFQTLRIACALCDIDPARGDEFMEELRDLYELSKMRGRGEKVSIGNSLQHVISLAGQVLADRADGGDKYEQLVKVRSIGRRVFQSQHALLDEIAAEPKGRLTPE